MFIVVWLRTLLWPTPTTFESNISAPEATIGRACIWVFLGNLLTYWLAFLMNMIISDISTEFITQYWKTLLWSALVFVPLISFLGVVVLIVGTGVAQMLARLFGGLGTYTKLIYALATFVAPLSILRIVLDDALHLQGASILLWIYGCILTVIAFKSLHRFGWKPALALGIPLASIFAVPLPVFIVVGITMLSIFGPTISRMLNLSK